MATYFPVWFLSLLILYAKQGCCDEIPSLSESEEHGNWTRLCRQQPHFDDIKSMVQAFNNHGNWSRLQSELGAVLDQGSQLYQQLQHARSPFHVGRYNYMQLARLLLCSGLHSNIIDSNGENILHGAALGGRLSLVKLLIRRGARVDVRNLRDYTPLMRAANNGHLLVVKYLVRSGADIYARSSFGHQAVDYARAQGHTEVVQYLQGLTE